MSNQTLKEKKWLKIEIICFFDVNVKIVKIVGVGMVTHENPNSSTTITGLGLSEELHLGYFPLFGTFPERFNQISRKKRLGMI